MYTLSNNGIYQTGVEQRIDSLIGNAAQATAIVGSTAQ